MDNAPARPARSSRRSERSSTPPQAQRRRRRRRFGTLLTLGLVALVAVVLLAAVPWLVVALFVNADTLRPQIEAATLRATGRTLTFGHLTMLSSLPPTFAAEDVSFANAPGGSRPAMLSIPYAEATLGILPLLYGRLQITSLLLSRPDLVLETDPAGTGNWQFAPPPAALMLGRAQTSPRPRWARRHAGAGAGAGRARPAAHPRGPAGPAQRCRRLGRGRGHAAGRRFGRHARNAACSPRSLCMPTAR